MGGHRESEPCFSSNVRHIAWLMDGNEGQHCSIYRQRQYEYSVVCHVLMRNDGHYNENLELASIATSSSVQISVNHHEIQL